MEAAPSFSEVNHPRTDWSFQAASFDATRGQSYERPTSGPLYHGVAANHFAVPLSAEFGRPLLRLEIHVVKAESLAIAVGPFEVVEQAPEEITLYRVAFGRGAVHVRDVIAKIHDAIGVFDVSAGIDHIVGGTTVFSDVERLGLPKLGGVANGPIECFGVDVNPRRSHVGVRGWALFNCVSGG